jgi:hypothetical protein
VCTTPEAIRFDLNSVGARNAAIPKGTHFSTAEVPWRIERRFPNLHKKKLTSLLSSYIRKENAGQHKKGPSS